MTIPAADRPLESLKEETIDRLIMNYSHGKLSMEAFERRLEQAMEAKGYQVLQDLTADLELEIDTNYVEHKKEELGFKVASGEAEEQEYVVNIFGGSNRSGLWHLPREIVSINIFGGGDIDLTDAYFHNKEVRIKVISVFAGTTIYVPENVNVSSKAFCIFAGMDNNAPSTNDRSNPTVIVEGIAVFSGIDIKVRRTIKERFIEFADGLKRLFG